MPRYVAILRRGDNQAVVGVAPHVFIAQRLIPIGCNARMASVPNSGVICLLSCQGSDFAEPSVLCRPNITVLPCGGYTQVTGSSDNSQRNYGRSACKCSNLPSRSVLKFLCGCRSCQGPDFRIPKRTVVERRAS